MPKLTTAVEMKGSSSTTKSARAGMRVVMLTLDTHLSSAAQRSAAKLAQKLPGLEFKLHAASYTVPAKMP